MYSKPRKKASARDSAYRLLHERPRSEFEIRSRLKEKGHDEAAIDEAVEYLRRVGDIDDARFAKFWVESRMHLNPAGDVVLRHELKQKGVAAGIIDDALEAKASVYDEYEIALSMARDRFERLKKLDRRKASKRLYDFLLRRGFEYENVRKVIEELTVNG